MIGLGEGKRHQEDLDFWIEQLGGCSVIAEVEKILGGACLGRKSVLEEK